MEPKLRFKEFSGDWEEKRLEDIADVLSGKRIPKGMSLSTIDTGIKYITVSDMGDKYINIENIKYISEDIEKKIKKYKVSENDIIISVAGTLGKINIVTKDFQNANLTENCDKITNLKGIKYEYLYMYLNSSYIQNQINSIYTVSSQPKLALTRIRDFIINTPSLAEQTKIADFLSTVDEKIQNQQDKITHLENIKKGFMQKIFSRKIRFKDANGNEFPEWEEKKIKDVFKITRGYVLSANNVENTINGEYIYPVYSSQTRDNGLLGYYNEYLYEDAITWTTDGANAGTVHFRKGKFYCTNVCGVLLNENGYSNKCIAEMINRISKKHVSYVGNPKLMNNVMAEIKINFPCLEEQQKIADFLSSFDEKIDAEKETLEHLKELKKGLLQQMFV